MSNIDFDIMLVNKYKNKMQSCKDSGIEFNLPLSSFRNVMKAKKCYYTGVALDWNGKEGEKISIDRVDATKGYVVGNVVACSTRANTIKAYAEAGHRVAGMDTESMVEHLKQAKRVLEISIKRMKLGVK